MWGCERLWLEVILLSLSFEIKCIYTPIYITISFIKTYYVWLYDLNAMCGYYTWTLCVVIILERYVWLLYLNMCGYYTWICVVIILEYVWLFYLNMWGYYTWICVVIILEYVWLYDLNNMCGYNSLRSMCGYMTGVCMYYRTWIRVWFYDLNIRMWL